MMNSYGPFAPFETDEIGSILKECQIEYEVQYDEKLANSYRSLRELPRPYGGDPSPVTTHRYLFVLVDSEKIKKVGSQLENFGINPIVDLRMHSSSV